MATYAAPPQAVDGLDATDLSADHLLEGLRAGDHAAFTELYHQQVQPIYAFTLRLLGNPDEAMDVTQEVFIKAYRRLPGCGMDMRVRPWLYRVAMNASVDQLRRRKALRLVDRLPEEIDVPQPDPFEQAELGETLERTLAGLSLRHRAALLLKDVHGLSHKEIAGMLGVSHGATEVLLFRAREAFRRGYTALTDAELGGACDLARRSLVNSIGRDGITEDERRRLAKHAQDCPDCARVVQTWGLGAVGLGALLHTVHLPAALATPPFTTALGTVGLHSIASAGTSGGAAASTAGSGMAGGGLAHVAGLTAGALAKTAVIVAAAGTLAVGSTVTIHHFIAAQRHGPAVALVSRTAGQGGGGEARASVSEASGLTPTAGQGVGPAHSKGRPGLGGVQVAGRGAGRARGRGSHATTGSARGNGSHGAATSARAHGSSETVHPVKTRPSGKAKTKPAGKAKTKPAGKAKTKPNGKSKVKPNGKSKTKSSAAKPKGKSGGK